MTEFFGLRQTVRAVGGLAERFARARRRRETMRILEGLPSTTLKDIGFVRAAPRFSTDVGVMR